MELVQDRFVSGIRSEYVQEALLRSPPETLDDARDAARRLEAAQAARRRMRARRTDVCATTSGEEVADKAPSSMVPPRGEVTAVEAARVEYDRLADAVQRNTEMLGKLMTQLTHSSGPGLSPGTEGGHTRRRRRPGTPATCWSCGQPGHLRRDCPATGNGRRPATWVERRPRGY